jgi:hypothetical protein
MWLCVLRAVELQSPWCSPSEHKAQREQAERDALKRERTQEAALEKESRHGPHMHIGNAHYHANRARFQMI